MHELLAGTNHVETCTLVRTLWPGHEGQHHRRLRVGYLLHCRAEI